MIWWLTVLCVVSTVEAILIIGFYILRLHLLWDHETKMALEISKSKRMVSDLKNAMKKKQLYFKRHEWQKAKYQQGIKKLQGFIAKLRFTSDMSLSGFVKDNSDEEQYATDLYNGLERETQ